ncbi:MAG: CRISPR-associated endonuclease Cas1 [Anaerolineae bacterium]|nr:CRISPR-associated endonuclease Cas1 [Anaerolineae bacterium]MCB0206014.1 CRISPR-associated endonuclease Cas1 [Anaerolineae bacterium]MCB0256328.1 CRISPR-associated endonuclease Cas1 [Anaerolineae bacterium]
MPIVRHLIVEEYGTFVGKHSQRLQVERVKTREKLAQAPLLHLETVLIATRGTGLSSDAVAACAERGIPIHFVSSRGQPYASLYSAGLTGTVETRRAQLLATTGAKGLELAKAVAIGKIRNQANLLKYMAKYRKEKDPALFDQVRLLAVEVADHEAEILRLAGDAVAAVRFELLSAEGRAAQKYWRAIGALLLAEMDWPGRRTQGATDPLNSALNYGYGILYSTVERACVLAGLDPYAGFLHVDRPGKPSLVLDLVEEFRQPAVDKTVLGMVNKGMAVELDDQGRLTPPSRRLLAEKVLARLDSPVRYEGKSHALQSVIQMQARHVATFVRGEREHYEPFIMGW